MPNTQVQDGARWHMLAPWLTAAVTILTLGCGDDGTTPVEQRGSRDSGVGVDGGPTPALDSGAPGADAGVCAQREAAFSAFVRAHSSCLVDADCAIIGDCCPHADFPVVQSAVRAEARAMQLGLCEPRACDGPTYTAVCRDSRCGRVQNPADQWCGAASRGDDAGATDAGP